MEDFGQEILAVPDKSGFGLAAWVVPLLVVLVGLAVAIGVAVVWRRRTSGDDPDGGAAARGAAAAGARRAGGRRPRGLRPRMSAWVERSHSPSPRAS